MHIHIPSTRYSTHADSLCPRFRTYTVRNSKCPEHTCYCNQSTLYIHSRKANYPRYMQHSKQNTVTIHSKTSYNIYAPEGLLLFYSFVCLFVFTSKYLFTKDVAYFFCHSCRRLYISNADHVHDVTYSDCQT